MTWPWRAGSKLWLVDEPRGCRCGLQWRREQRTVLLLMDDGIGRAEAQCQAVYVTDTAAVVALAQEQGLIAAAAPVLDDVRVQGYLISPAIVAAVLEQLP